MRVDRFLKESLPQFSMQNVHDLLAARLITWDDSRRIAEKGETIQPGATLTWINAPDLSILPIPNPAIRLQVHHQDPHFLIVEKPAPMPTQPLAPWERDTVANGLIAAFADLHEVGDQPLEPGLLHRLDTETSGLLLVARTPAAWQAGRRLFKEKKIDKEYLALVSGVVKKAASCKLPLQHDTTDRRKMRVASDNSKQRCLEAITHFTPERNLATQTLLRVTIPTGVMHQIRVHLSHLGHPIVGDSLYGVASDKPSLSRHFLHAHRLKFTHPITQKTVEVISPLPEELAAFLKE